MAKGTKANFKNSQEEHKSILSQIRGGKYSPLYLLMGEEEYFIDSISQAISTEILTEQEREFNLSILYGKDVSGADICELARSYPMMASYNIVIVRGAQQCDSLELLSHYLADEKLMPQSTILVLCYVGKMDRRSQLYKRIEKLGVVFESVPARDYEMSGWIEELFKSHGATIEAKATAMLVENMGSQLANIANEVTKMFISLGGKVKKITPSEIENYIGISKEYNIFELTKALSERDSARALRIVDYFRVNRNEANIYGSFTTLFTHYRRLFTLGMLYWEIKKKGMSPPSDSDIMSLLKLSSVIFVREYKGALSHCPPAKSFKAMSLVREYDMKTKGVCSGGAGGGDLLFELIIKLLSL